ncbi:hypothetical protein ER308_11095 [Egibacter rhizosphaerae]|uniref:Uncharacterized protein n=2 Tax=Egibacter rhizosphaerae TaxID=1670831 RepID=A0A411YG39_9ACTN|nr:hypothetical protein ER308_11095 [Egibacter rhizosphaerae]
MDPSEPADTATVASRWTPDATLAGDDGAVAPVFVWSALDCPSGYMVFEGRRTVLASLRIRQDAPVPTGEELIVLGWGRGSERRKFYAASALQDARGEVLAVADTLWIELQARVGA